MRKTHLPVARAFLLVVLLLAGSAFCADPGEEALLSWSNKCLSECFDSSAEKLKKWELTLTESAFLRVRKTYTNGKQEYFSFHMHRFNDINYLGTVNNGILKLRTNDTDIIVQTYNDRKGNIDTMAAELSIPVKNMEPERLDSLRNALMYFKNKDVSAAVK